MLVWELIESVLEIQFANHPVSRGSMAVKPSSHGVHDGLHSARTETPVWAAPARKGEASGQAPPPTKRVVTAASWSSNPCYRSFCHAEGLGDGVRWQICAPAGMWRRVVAWPPLAGAQARAWVGAIAGALKPQTGHGFYLIGLHGPSCFDLSWAKTMKFDGDGFCLSYFIWFWCGFHFASFGWIDPGFRPALKRIVPRTQLRARGEKRLLFVVTGAIPAWWPSSAVGLVTVLLASRFDWVIVLHISIFPYFLTVQRVRGAAYLGAANFLFWACYCNSNDIPTLGFCRHAHCDRIGHGSTATAL